MTPDQWQAQKCVGLSVLPIPNNWLLPPENTETEKKINLECEQWRHGVKPELFFGEIHADLTKDEINGALECRVHAENASQVNTAQIPIRIKIREISAYDLAKNRIEYLLAGMNKLISDEA